jgi:hypothetical protein
LSLTSRAADGCTPVTHRRQVLNAALSIPLGGLATVTAIACATPLSAEINYERVEPSSKSLAQMQTLTPADVAKGVVIDDDDFATRAELATSNAYRNNGRFADPVRADNFMRAWIDKKTGSVMYQLYQTVTYGYDWRNFTYVNYASPTGPQTAKLEQIAREAIACYGDSCTYRETVGFMVGEDLLKTIADQYVAGNTPPWRFKFRATKGFDWEDSITPAEVAGLLLAVDAYRSQHSLPTE